MIRALLVPVLLAGAAFSMPSLAAHHGESVAPATAPAAEEAKAALRDASGAVKGTAKVWTMGDGIHVDVAVSGMTAGSYAIHLHQVGQCAAPAFTSAGGHWNPAGVVHGRATETGGHKGDLPNLVVGADGTASLSVHIDKAQLKMGDGALMDADGAAVVIHANLDDNKTDPAGNAGARIICGVLTFG